MDKITNIIVSKENVSDDQYLIGDIYFENGQTVKKGDIVSEIETSKSNIAIESPIDGYIYFAYEVGDSIKVNSIFAAVLTNNNLPEGYFDRFTKQKGPINSLDIVESKISVNVNQRVSKPALKLIEEHNIPIDTFMEKTLVEKKDVIEYLDNISRENKQLTPSKKGTTFFNSVILVGGGNHTKACIDIILQNHQFDIAGIVFTQTIPDQKLLGYPSLGSLRDLEYLYENVAKNAIVAIGGLENILEREELFNKLKKVGFAVPNLIHPRAIIEPSVRLGEGNQIFGGANLGSCSVIGDNCLINSNAIVSHDCLIDNNVHLTPGAILAGTVQVGANSIIGMGSSVFYKTTIGKGVVINNGKHIFKDVPDYSKVK